jgi:hypothetical protein
MMNNSTLSGTGLEVLQIVRSSIMLRWMVQRHSDLLAVLMQAAERADRDPANRARLLEAVSLNPEAKDRIHQETCRPDTDGDESAKRESSLPSGREKDSGV